MNAIYIKYNHLDRQFLFNTRVAFNVEGTGADYTLQLLLGLLDKKLKSYKEAYVSGWMLGKGQVRRRNMRGLLYPITDLNDLNQPLVNVAQKKYGRCMVTQIFLQRI